MAKTPHDVRILACAAGMGDLDTVRAVLRRSPEAARDWRPIMDASYKGFAPVVAELVKHGADVNALSAGEHNRPLHRAAEQGHEDVIKVLVKSGADLEARGTWLQITPLIKAAFSGRASTADMLVGKGARVDRFSAAAIGKTSKAALGVDSNGLTTLHYVAGSSLGRPELVTIAQHLLQGGADPNAKVPGSGHNVTPIKLAIHNQPVAEVLLGHGAHADDVFRDVLLSGCTDFAFAEALLKRGAELNPLVWGSEKLLHVTIHWGRLGAAEWLLRKGADPNTVREKDGWTPLHQAASRGVSSIITSLLKHGADPKVKDHAGQTPLQVARTKRRAAVVSLLA